MPSEMERKLARARSRLLAERLLNRLAASLAWAAVAAAVLLIVNNFFYPLGLMGDSELLKDWSAWLGAENLRWLAANWFILPACVAAAILYSAAVLLAGRMSLMRTAIFVDSRLGLRECFSTAVELEGLDRPKSPAGGSELAGLSQIDDPFAKAAINQAENKAGKLANKDISGQFPIRLGRVWRWPAVCWAAVILLVMFLPVFDLFGAMSCRDTKARQDKANNQAKVEIKKAAEKIETLVKQLDNENLKEDLEKLKELAEKSKGEELQRQAVKRLTDLSDKIKNELQADKKMESAQALKDLLKQLKSSSNPSKEPIKNALAKGDVKKAMDKMEEMKNKLEEGKMSKEELEELKKELENIADQLDKIDYEQQAAKELQDSGMSKQDAQAKAGLSDEQLREELKKEGYTDEQIDQIMEKLSALRQACKQCKKLSDSMRDASGRQFTPEELARLAEQLGEMDGQMSEAELVRATLEEIEGEIARLGMRSSGEGDDYVIMPGNDGDESGCGLDGDGGRQCANNGNVSQQTNGPPGPGIGRGSTKSEADEKGNADYDKVGVKNQSSDGPIIASKIFKGPQVKGEAKQQFDSTVQAAKDGASEAIKDNKIPKKYESSVKKYFGNLEQADKSGN